MTTPCTTTTEATTTTERPGGGRVSAQSGTLLAAAGLLAAAAVGAALWFAPREGERPAGGGAGITAPAPPASAGAETESDEPAVLNASGYVTARLQATVSSKVTGRVVEVLFEEGMAVRAGQVLARLDDSSPRAQLRLAEASLSAAESAVSETVVRRREALLELERQRQLVERGVAPQTDEDAARAEADALAARIGARNLEVAVARREVDLRRADLDDTVIRAPFSGIALARNAQPGEMVSPVSGGGGFTRTGICTIVDMSSLEIEVDVNESYINRVRPGQRAIARIDAYPDWRIPATVVTMVPAADRQRATVMVRLRFDELDPRILPDMGVNVAFLDDTPEDAANEPDCIAGGIPAYQGADRPEESRP